MKTRNIVIGVDLTTRVRAPAGDPRAAGSPAAHPLATPRPGGRLPLAARAGWIRRPPGPLGGRRRKLCRGQRRARPLPFSSQSRWGYWCPAVGRHGLSSRGLHHVPIQEKTLSLTAVHTGVPAIRCPRRSAERSLQILYTSFVVPSHEPVILRSIRREAYSATEYGCD